MEGADRKDPDKMPEPPQLASFNMKRQRLYSELPAAVLTPFLSLSLSLATTTVLFL